MDPTSGPFSGMETWTGQWAVSGRGEADMEPSANQWAMTGRGEVVAIPGSREVACCTL